MAMARGRKENVEKKNFFLAFVEQETKSQWKGGKRVPEGGSAQQEGKKRRRAKLDE